MSDLSFDDLTLAEIATIERHAGLPINLLVDDGQPKGRALAAMALVFGRRRGRPDLTWDTAQELTFAEASTLLGLAGPATEVAAEPELAGADVVVAVQADPFERPAYLPPAPSPSV